MDTWSSSLKHWRRVPRASHFTNVTRFFGNIICIFNCPSQAQVKIRSWEVAESWLRWGVLLPRGKWLTQPHVIFCMHSWDQLTEPQIKRTNVRQRIFLWVCSQTWIQPFRCLWFGFRDFGYMCSILGSFLLLRLPWFWLGWQKKAKQIPVAY